MKNQCRDACSVTLVHRHLLGYLCTQTPAGLPVCTHTCWVSCVTHACSVSCVTHACWFICIHRHPLGYLCAQMPARLPVYRCPLGYLCHTCLLHMPARLSVCTDTYSVTCVHTRLLGYLCTHTPAQLSVYTHACSVTCVTEQTALRTSLSVRSALTMKRKSSVVVTF